MSHVTHVYALNGTTACSKDKGLYLESPASFIAYSKYLQSLSGHKWWEARVVWAWKGNPVGLDYDEDDDVDDHLANFIANHQRLGANPPAPQKDGHPTSTRENTVMWKKLPTTADGDKRPWALFSSFRGYEIDDLDDDSDDEERRPSAKEMRQIRPGSVFVWDEREAGIRRWTDGRSWSTGRKSGSAMRYLEVESKRGDGFGSNQCVPKLYSGRHSDEPHDNAQFERCRYKTNGLMKLSFRITTLTNERLHLISYYSRIQLDQRNLHRPSSDQSLRSILPTKSIYPEFSMKDTNLPNVRRHGVRRVLAEVNDPLDKLWRHLQQLPDLRMLYVAGFEVDASVRIQLQGTRLSVRLETQNATLVDAVELYSELVYPAFPYFHEQSYTRRIFRGEHLANLTLFATALAILAITSSCIRDGALINRR
ncbi:Protein kinase domain-containing protein ppk32 [Purpureocillium lavendulum]|uniref:Protein kinase domain-containing protein ppk32 n=1 Tax=Purpureocillium lavendulum TaxID=1247861 RepID=A0AB34FFU5_9HYPO|nr:Protein kinase domain-containing protein ppk32 [Purpureocillium lavendulum]